MCSLVRKKKILKLMFIGVKESTVLICQLQLPPVTVLTIDLSRDQKNKVKRGFKYLHLILSYVKTIW